MNGHGGMAGVAGTNGTTLGPEPVLPRIHEALELVHNRYSSNQARQEAQGFLESVKNTDDAPSHGYALACDHSQAPIVRHYALSLLEHTIKHKWAEHQSNSMRDCVQELSKTISRDDPPYIRNKVAQLWVEVAKRSWVAQWMDMDMMLVQLWQVPDSPVHKELVLLILESLAEEIFNGDDAVVAVREGVLSKASVEIFTPAAVLADTFPNRQPGPNVRCGDEGWLKRITDFLGQCLLGDLQNNIELRNCTVRGLAVIYSLMPWVIPNAATATGCVPVLCEALRASHFAVQKAALEAMHALYSRTSFAEQEFLDLVVPLYHPKYVLLFKQLFEWSTVDADDIDDDKYQFGNKLSELVSFLGNYMDRRFSVLPKSPEQVDFQGFLHLLLLITQSQSLGVSIPALVTWTRLLNNRAIGPNIAELPAFIGPLLEVCGARQLRYEALPEDTQEPTVLFLIEDTDTVPERHAFLGNYRRYSAQVIESIVILKVADAIQHILGQTENMLEHLYDGQPPFNPATYSKTSAAVLRFDAQATMIEATLKGFNKWRSIISKGDLGTRQQEPSAGALEDSLEVWANRLFSAKFEDPLIRKRILQLLVAFSTTALDKKPGFVLPVLEHILLTWPAIQKEHKEYTEAIKELQSESMVELQRLASNMPDHLLTVYDQIATQVNEMIASGNLDEKRQVSYQTFLFTIVHRSTRLDMPAKLQKLREFVTPIKSQWQNKSFQNTLASYQGFCELMALDKAQAYLAQKRVHEIKDWGSVPLDAEGEALQAELEARQSALPLRPTKSFLTCSVEKTEKRTTVYETSCELWHDGLPTILPELLKFLRHAHASHAAENWVGLPIEMRSIVSRVLTDRFWQAGISEGSKDEFYARVLDKKHTVEGLASTIRGSIRFVRESCYAIVYCMSRLDMQFYGFDGLPGPLAHSLLADSYSLSPHQMINLINLVRYLVDNCPVSLRDHFLPPLLAACFQQMDAKINSEWQNLDQQQGVQAGEEALNEEMKTESILRQLTYTAVMMVADILDPARKDHCRPGSEHPVVRYPTLRKFCLMDSSIVEPLLMFSTHVIRMRDTRCGSIMLRVFRSIVPEFQTTESTQPKAGVDGKSYVDDGPIPASTAAVIREFMSSDVLKACITSLHEPYFVDLQKDLAVLIATILLYYCPLTPTPRNIILSLPNMHEAEVDKAIANVSRPGISTRHQRAVVLDLLRELKGVSISEMGKLNKTLGFAPPPSSSARGGGKKPTRSKMAQEFMVAPPASKAEAADDGLDGVANLFDA